MVGYPSDSLASCYLKVIDITVSPL